MINVPSMLTDILEHEEFKTEMYLNFTTETFNEHEARAFAGNGGSIKMLTDLFQRAGC